MTTPHPDERNSAKDEFTVELVNKDEAEDRERSSKSNEVAQ